MSDPIGPTLPSVGRNAFPIKVERYVLASLIETGCLDDRELPHDDLPKHLIRDTTSPSSDASTFVAELTGDPEATAGSMEVSDVFLQRIVSCCTQHLKLVVSVTGIGESRVPMADAVAMDVSRQNSKSE